MKVFASVVLLYVGAASAAGSVDDVLQQQRALLVGTAAQPSAQQSITLRHQDTHELTQRVLLGVTASPTAQAPAVNRVRLDQQVLSQRVLLGSRERG